MNPRLQQLQTIFDQARRLPSPAEQAAYLAEACGADEQLRKRVQEMLRDDAPAQEFFESNADAREKCAQLELKGSNLVVETEFEGPCSVIGRYKLLEKIGEGGMGVVYMAQQEEPVRRKVALKIIKLGMDTKAVVARFEAERQALALMDHPNIAKVLDAGATGTGRPYFVMELVQGVAITEFCSQNRLSVEERIKLFITVCQAVQSAHQKGIIHRDLKPTNILVIINAGAPMPMVIDFGVAKATNQRLTERTVFTNYAMIIGTPAYMSPEQAEMSRLDVDTRSDIYGLGVLLYELLTGTTPFPEKRLRSASYQEMQRIIMEEEPERPSTRLRQKSIDTSKPSLATGRYSLSTDLDWIVMKCLEKDRARRYETATGLAADLKRHLDNEPVVARPPSNFYRFQRLVRRNTLAFAAGTAVAAAMLVGLAVSTLLFIQERRAHDSATRAEHLAASRLTESENARKEAEAISKFLVEVFESPDPARDGRTITVAETLSAAAKKLETELANQPARRAKLQRTLGATFDGLGLFREAIPLQEEVRNYYLAVSGPEHPDTLAAMQDLANSYDSAGRLDEALKLREQVLTVRRKVLGPEHPNTFGVAANLANSYEEARRWDEALKLREEVLAFSRKVLGREHQRTLGAMLNLANSYENAGRRDEALKLREEAIPLHHKLNGAENPLTLTMMLTMMGSLANSYDSAGRLGESLKLREQVLELSRKIRGPEHRDTLAAMLNLAFSYDCAGRHAEAIKLREDLLALCRKALGEDHPDTVYVMQSLADSYSSVGRNKEAFAVLEEACKADPKNSDASLTLATWQTWFGQDAEYEATRRRQVEQAEGKGAVDLHRAAKGYCLRPSTDAALLAKVCNLALRSVQLGKEIGDPFLRFYQQGLGMAEYRNGQYADAERDLTVAEQMLVRAGPDNQSIARLYRVMSLFRQNRSEEARTLFRQAEAQMPPLPQDENKPQLNGGPVVHDLLICWLAYKEAKALIQAPSAPAAGPSVPR
jgi:serine/threonine protein kinase/tetratricopeptide (TPR) repeat protein